MIRHIDGPAGRLEALLDEPAWGCHISPVRNAASPADPDSRPEDQPRVAVVLAHPHPLHGGTMNNKVVYQVAKGLCRTRAAVLRFNFRGVGASHGTWDDGAGELADVRAAVAFMAGRYPGVEVWAGGFSFGAWAALTVGATDERVSALFGIAPPAKSYDFSALYDCHKPKFFVQGTLDTTCLLKDSRELYARLPEPKEFIEVDGADHLFDGQVAEVADVVQGLLGDFTAVRT
jgi:alpha/beta superfamily hydrolase